MMDTLQNLSGMWSMMSEAKSIFWSFLFVFLFSLVCPTMYRLAEMDVLFSQSKI